VSDPDDAMLLLAAIGSRQSGFNHDIASKIQGLMMALDELTELAESLANEDITRALETATVATRELNQLLTASRALTKPPAKARIALGELVRKAAERVGVVVRGEVPAVEIEVAVPLTQQGLALAIDAAAGVGRARTLEPKISVGERIEIGLPIATMPSNPTPLAIAAWIMRREGGELATSAEQIAIRLPAIK
jgi:hypothetical protein